MTPNNILASLLAAAAVLAAWELMYRFLHPVVVSEEGGLMEPSPLGKIVCLRSDAHNRDPWGANGVVLWRVDDCEHGWVLLCANWERSEHIKHRVAYPADVFAEMFTVVAS